MISLLCTQLPVNLVPILGFTSKHSLQENLITACAHEQQPCILKWLTHTNTAAAKSSEEGVHTLEDILSYYMMCKSITPCPRDQADYWTPGLVMLSVTRLPFPESYKKGLHQSESVLGMHEPGKEHFTSYEALTHVAHSLSSEQHYIREKQQRSTK